MNKFYLLPLFLMCFFASPTVAQCDGGFISTEQGATTLQICLEDGQSDSYTFVHTSLSFANYAYLITDTENRVISIIEDNVTSFEGSTSGDCRVWGISYTGTLDLAIGAEVTSMTIGENCQMLSDNYVSIIRRRAVYSEIKVVDRPDNFVEIEDPEGTIVNVESEPSLAENYLFVLVRSDGKIMSLNTEGNFDLASFAAGSYSIMAYAYTGEVLIRVGDNLYNFSRIATGCSQESANSITVKKLIENDSNDCPAEGGMVRSQNNETSSYICLNDGEDDFVGFTNNSLSASSYTYLITDTNNVILALAEEGYFNFEGFDDGVCRVWGLSYEGVLNVEIGQSIALPTLALGCYELSSNYLNIIKAEVSASTITTSTGLTNLTLEEGANTAITFRFEDSSLVKEVFVITNINNRIIDTTENTYDFSSLDSGKYFVYGYRYSGNTSLQRGRILEGLIADGCSAKSTNLIFVRKNTSSNPSPPCSADAGTLSSTADRVTLVDGRAALTATPNDDEIIPEDLDKVYVLTQGEDLTVMMLSPVPFFSVTQAGNYRIHTLIAELNDPNHPDFFDGSVIETGVSTANDILEAIAQQGICADLDVRGVAIEVIEDESCTAAAGTLVANEEVVMLQAFTLLSASTSTAPTVPFNYEVKYLLTYGEEEIIEQITDAPFFIVNKEGNFKIHTLVAEITDENSSHYLDLDFILLGTTSYTTLDLIINATDICAALEEPGASIQVVSASSTAFETNRSVAAETSTPFIADNAISTATSREEVSSSTVAEVPRFYPNPVQEFLRIEIPSSTLSSINIYHISGQLVQSFSLSELENNATHTIDVSKWQDGFYIIQYIQGGVAHTHKILKQARSF